MNQANPPSKIAFVSDYLPRRCGIATFTYALRDAVAAQYPDVECGVLAINDLPEGYDYREEVRFEIQEQRLRDYQEAVNFLRFNGFDVLCLQHEFGIYGGRSGSHILTILRQVDLPVVTTLHTILQEPAPDQRRVMDEIVRQSERLVVMTERGRTILREIYRAPAAKIDLIAHGIPETPFVDPDSLKDQFGVEGRKVLLTFGLLSPGKGIEYVIEALPEITRQHPDLIYIVLGATHPNLVRAEGEAYRLSLKRLAEKLGMTPHVAFYNRFVELEELEQFIGAADIYVTPYLSKAQATSGTLCFAFGCGKAVVSTPYWHAEELLEGDRGVLVPFRDSAAIATAVCGLLDDEARLDAMRKRAYLAGRGMIWSQAARHYFASFREARADHRHHHGPRFEVKTLAQQPLELPELTLDHVERLTDSIGIFQHAAYAMPSYADGYCTDDNARALLLMVLLEFEPRHAGPPAACDPVFRLRGARVRPQQPPLSKFHGFRSALAGRARLRRLLRALSLGVGHVSWAFEAPKLPEVGSRALSSGPAGVGGDELASRLGIRADRRAGIPGASERRSQRQRDQRPADRKSDSLV